MSAVLMVFEKGWAHCCKWDFGWADPCREKLQCLVLHFRPIALDLQLQLHKDDTALDPL